jgi:membrane-associated progesterone receptor component
MSQSWDFKIVVTVAVGAVALYMLLPRLFGKQAAEEEPAPTPLPAYQRLPVGKLNTDQIVKYRGQDDSRILISVCGRIFDASRGGDFYGPDGPYHCFTGADASYMLATMSLDVENRNKNGFELEGDAQMTLTDWISRFRGKYPYVGRLEGFEGVAPESWREGGFDDEEQKENNEMTLEELKASSSDMKKNWVSVGGYVFDVSEAYAVYEHGMDFGNVRCLAHDISVCLARNTFSKDLLDQPTNVLQDSPDQVKRLADILRRFRETYRVVGKLAGDSFACPVDDSEEWDIVNRQQEVQEEQAQEKPEETEDTGN